MALACRVCLVQGLVVPKYTREGISCIFHRYSDNDDNHSHTVLDLSQHIFMLLHIVHTKICLF
jgi:hypothetical protein